MQLVELESVWYLRTHCGQFDEILETLDKTVPDFVYRAFNYMLVRVVCLIRSLLHTEKRGRVARYIVHA